MQKKIRIIFMKKYYYLIPICDTFHRHTPHYSKHSAHCNLTDPLSPHTAVDCVWLADAGTASALLDRGGETAGGVSGPHRGHHHPRQAVTWWGQTTLTDILTMYGDGIMWLLRERNSVPSQVTLQTHNLQCPVSQDHFMSSTKYTPLLQHLGWQSDPPPPPLICDNTQTLSQPSLHVVTITASSRRDVVNLYCFSIETPPSFYLTLPTIPILTMDPSSFLLPSAHPQQDWSIFPTPDTPSGILS